MRFQWYGMIFKRYMYAMVYLLVYIVKDKLEMTVSSICIGCIYWVIWEGVIRHSIPHPQTDWLIVYCLTSRSTHNAYLWTRHHYRWRAEKIGYAWRWWPLSREGSLSCYSCCDTGLVIRDLGFYSLIQRLSNLVTLHDRQVVLRTHSYTGLHRISQLRRFHQDKAKLSGMGHP